MTSEDCQSLEMDFEKNFDQMVLSCPRRNHMKSINLNKQNCKTQYHGCKRIFGFCVNKNCQAVSKKVCEYCIRGQLHDKEIGFSYKDLLFEDQVDRIIEMFKQQIRLKLEKAKLSFWLHQTTIFDNLSTVDKRQQDIDRLNNQFIECEQFLEKLSLINYIEEVESSNTGLYQYLFQIYQLFIKLESDLQQLINMLQQNQSEDGNQLFQVNEQNQWQREKVRKCKLDLLCKILKSRIYLEGEIDYEQSQIIKSQFEMMLNIGIEYADENNFNAAFQICDIICEQNKYNQQAYLKKGIILDKQKKYEEALEQFDKVLELEPNNSESLFRKGKKYFNFQGLTYNHLNQYEQALTFFNYSLNQDPCNFNVLNQMANIFIKLNQYQKAIKTLNNLIDKCDNISQRQKVDRDFLLESQTKIKLLIRGYQQFQDEILNGKQNLPSLKYFYTLEKGNFDKAIDLNPTFYLAYDKKAQYLKNKENYSGQSNQQEQLYQQGILLYNMDTLIVQLAILKLNSDRSMFKKNSKNTQNHQQSQKE